MYKNGQKIGTYQFGHKDYKNGGNLIEKGRWEWATKEENDEHRRRYRIRHANEKDSFPSAGYFAYHYLWG